MTYTLAPLTSTERGNVNANEIYDLLSRGLKIQAIKEIRQVAGIGLKEAKDVADAAERERYRSEGVRIISRALAASEQYTISVHHTIELHTRDNHWQGSIVSGPETVTITDGVRRLVTFPASMIPTLIEALAKVAN